MAQGPRRVSAQRATIDIAEWLESGENDEDNDFGNEIENDSDSEIEDVVENQSSHSDASSCKEEIETRQVSIMSKDNSIQWSKTAVVAAQGCQSCSNNVRSNLKIT